MKNQVENWENSLNSADFASHDQHQRFLVWLLKYKKTAQYKALREQFETFGQLKSKVLVPIFLVENNEYDAAPLLVSTQAISLNMHSGIACVDTSNGVFYFLFFHSKYHLL
jgi:hypothetical protein